MNFHLCHVHHKRDFIVPRVGFSLIYVNLLFRQPSKNYNDPKKLYTQKLNSQGECQRWENQHGTHKYGKLFSS